MTNVEPNDRRSDAPKPDSSTIAAVQAQLELILAHKLFSETTRMKRFLKYIVDETLAGRSRRLKGYSIGLEVFDRPDSFDPQLDTIVRVQAGQLRRRLDRYYAGNGKEDAVRIMVPKGHYIPLFEIRGSAGDTAGLTVSGESRTGDIVRMRAAALQKPVGPQIVVTDLESIGGSADDIAFARGLTAEIMNALTHFRYLSVVYSGDSRAVDTARPHNPEPEFGFVLKGSVRRVDNVVRVTARLIDVQTGAHVFSRRYDRDYTLDSLLELHEDISSYIAAAVGAPYGVVNRVTRARAASKAMTLANYEAILNFYAFVRCGNPDNYEAIFNQLSAVTRRHPEYSAGWAALSLLDSFQASQNPQVTDRAAVFARALNHAKKAVEIDSHDSLAFLALFSVQFHLGDIEGYEIAAASALKLNPNDDHLLGFYGVTLACLGETEAALDFMTKALEHNLNPPDWYKFPLFIQMLRAGAYADLVSTVSERLDRDFVWGQALIKSALGRLEDTDALNQLLKDSPELTAQSTPVLTQMLPHWNIESAVRDNLIGGWVKADQLI